MADFNKNLAMWFQDKAKIWVFRLIVAGGTIMLALGNFGIFVIPINISLVFLLSIIYLFAEVFLTEISHIKQLKNEGLILNWHEATLLLRVETIQAKEITIIARTGETFYYALRDILLSKGNFKFKLILIQFKDEEKKFLDYQQGWIKRWESLFKEINAECKIISVCTTCEIQGIILDDELSYFGFRDRSTGTNTNLLTHLRTSSYSTQGRFIMRYLNNWIKNHELIN